MTLVLDASVVVKLAVQEQGRDDIVSLLARRDDAIVVPDLMFVELANALWRKCLGGEVTVEQAKEAIRHAVETFREVMPSRELAGRAFELAVQLKHPAYDCFYLACALIGAGQVVTADARFVDAARRGGYSDRLLTLGEAD